MILQQLHKTLAGTVDWGTEIKNGPVFYLKFEMSNQSNPPNIETLALAWCFIGDLHMEQVPNQGDATPKLGIHQ
jgi:hypothetical protein